MIKEQIHLLVIWSSAIDKQNSILDDLKQSFKIINTFRIEWDKDKFLQNYIVFYAHSQKHLNKSQLQSLLLGKIAHCGNDEFTAVIFKDPSPKMEKRITSNGLRIVNTNVFDKKCKYRDWLGGGHKIHASDDAWETNKDLTLLFGLNTTDFLKKHDLPQANPIIYKKNCIGVDGYESIQQLFYVLNNTIDYCVLRNHECLPNEYTIEGHGDIDLLVEDKNYISYLTLAKPIYPEPYRVYHTINIAGKEIPFDFRHIGDNYYDSLWQKKILRSRKLSKSLFYVPDDEEQYYSLLYHVYIQKHEVKSDYIPTLIQYANNIGVNYINSIQNAISQLDTHLQNNGYEYIRPKDVTVVYNIKNLQYSSYAYRYGTFVKRTHEEGSNGYTYYSLVYKKENSYIKRGTDWLLKNEVDFLKELSSENFTPKLINSQLNIRKPFIEISKIPGIEFQFYFANINHQRKCYIRSFIKEVITIFETLNHYKICHRDFLPGNLIVSEYKGKSKVGIIDFGWSTHFYDKDSKTPKDLGGNYCSSKGYSDLYTFGSLLLEYWYDVPYIRRIALALIDENYIKYNKQANILKIVKQRINYPFTPYDEFRLFIRRHQRPHFIKVQIQNYILSIFRRQS